MTQKEYAIVVAGGKGSRFGSSVPKQFLELNGKPVLLHTLEAFYQYSQDLTVVLVLPEEDIATWHDISQRCNFKKPLLLQTGGSTRFQSVKKGLAMVGDDGCVAIHDGVRPLVTPEIIASSFRLARAHECAVAAIGLKDSIRMIEMDIGSKSFITKTIAVDRTFYRLIQTPQTFRTALIKQAYSMPEDPALTDDASVAERAGHSIFLFEGSYENIKITTAEDLVVAQAFLTQRQIV